MADAVDSKSTAGNCIPVQVRSPAPVINNPDILIIDNWLRLDLITNQKNWREHEKKRIERVKKASQIY